MTLLEIITKRLDVYKANVIRPAVTEETKKELKLLIAVLTAIVNEAKDE